MVLTAKQRSDLHVAIYGYLTEQGFGSSAAELLREANIEVASSSMSRTSLLEKKWTSVVRLQRKVQSKKFLDSFTYPLILPLGHGFRG